jgi:branched-chain amino acid transport system substrate-binding protein
VISILGPELCGHASEFGSRNRCNVLDGSKKESVTNLLERLIVTDGAKFIFAPYGSGLTLAGAPVTEKDKALYNSHGGPSDRTFQQGYKYAVQTIVVGSRYLLTSSI